MNEEAASHGLPASTLGRYITSAQFWFESLQNWQSEFLAIFAIVMLSIWLREKGSPESKSVSAPMARPVVDTPLHLQKKPGRKKLRAGTFLFPGTVYLSAATLMADSASLVSF